jgi:hypothetical protein
MAAACCCCVDPLAGSRPTAARHPLGSGGGGGGDGYTRRFPGLRELRFEPDGDVFSPYGHLLPALEALPLACLPAVERAAGPPDVMQHLNPLAVVQLARLCPGLRGVGFGGMASFDKSAPEDCGHIGPALEALAAGCRNLASLDLHIGISLNHVDGDPNHASAEAVASAAAGLRRLGGGLRELSVEFCSSESDSTAARTLLPAVLPSLTALSWLTVGGESGVVVGAPSGSLRHLGLYPAEAVGELLATVEGPLPGVTSLDLAHISDQ